MAESTNDFIVLEATTATTGKPSWAIWHRTGTSTAYSELIARAYSAEWAAKICKLLNEADD